MFQYSKKLQYPVKIDKCNPRLASVIISQYGGPDGEMAASLRYLSQRYSMPFDETNATASKQQGQPMGRKRLHRIPGFCAVSYDWYFRYRMS